MSSEKKTNQWIEHCKAYAKEHGCSYRDAIKNSKESYQPRKSEKEHEPEIEVQPLPLKKEKELKPRRKIEVEIEPEDTKKVLRKRKKNILQ
jgi:hypothetical protein